MKTVLGALALATAAVTPAFAADGDPAAGGVWIAFILGLYFLPSIIAKCRGHRSFGGIFVVNLFLGWTFIGWVGAFAWACSYPGDKPKPVTVKELMLGKSAAPRDRRWDNLRA